MANIEVSNAFQVINFLDNFDSFDTSLWSKETHRLGRSYITSKNVDVKGGYLKLNFPAKTYEGAEICSTSLYSYGTYTVRLKCPQAPGSISTFFLYQGIPGDGNDEIDIEIYNDGTRRIMFTTWVNGTQTNTATCILVFDPSREYHEYRIDFYQSEVSYYVDAQLLIRWTSGLPTNSMRLMSNAWWPTWLSGPKLRTQQTTSIDWIKITG